MAAAAGVQKNHLVNMLLVLDGTRPAYWCRCKADQFDERTLGTIMSHLHRVHIPQAPRERNAPWGTFFFKREDKKDEFVDAMNQLSREVRPDNREEIYCAQRSLIYVTLGYDYVDSKAVDDLDMKDRGNVSFEAIFEDRPNDPVDIYGFFAPKSDIDEMYVAQLTDRCNMIGEALNKWIRGDQTLSGGQTLHISLRNALRGVKITVNTLDGLSRTKRTVPGCGGCFACTRSFRRTSQSLGNTSEESRLSRVPGRLAGCRNSCTIS